MRIAVLSLLTFSLSAQTTVYLRMGGPAPVAISIADTVHGNPPTITTTTGHGLAVNDVVGIWGMCAGALFDPASAKTPLNGLHKVLSTPSTTKFTISDGPTSDTPLNEPNDPIQCGPDMGNPTAGGNWAAKYSAVTLPSGPFGWFDGLNGTITRKLSLRTTNGLAASGGVVVSGCPSNCVVTITTTYNHGMAAGDKFSVNGTTSSALNTAGTGNTQAPFTVESTTSTSFTSKRFTAGGLSNGDYTNHNVCGPNSTPNDTNTGTNPCVSISQFAYNGNPVWDRLLADTTALYGSNNPNGYKFPQDNPATGNYPNGPAYSVANLYSLAAVKWFVDPTDSASFTAGMYFMKNVEKSFAVSWPCYADIVFQACGVTGGGLQGDQDEFWAGLSFLAAIFAPAMAPASRQTFIDKMYNDTNDPGSTVTTAHTDMSEDKVNRVIAYGRAQGGSTTSITLAASDTQPNGYYVNNVVHLVYQTAITNWAIGAATVVTTASNWGFNANIPITANTIAVKISGVTGPGCATMNNWWQISSSGANQIDTTHFQIQNLPGCTAPVGGTVTSYEIQCPDAKIGVYHPCAGLITAYDAATKVATIAGGFDGLPTFAVTGEMSYKIYATISTSNPAGKATATITGYHTHFTTDLAVGDAIFGVNGYTSTWGYPWLVMSYVTNIIDDTHLTVLNEGAAVTTATPTIAWMIRAWKPGDTGFKWYGNHWQGAVGAQAVAYPASGGGSTACPSGTCPGANNGILYSHSRAGLGLSLAPYDSRAMKDLAMMWSYALDFELNHYLTYISGPGHSGSVYSLGNEYAVSFMATTLFAGIPGFPTLDTTWAKQTALWGIYSILPDLNWNSLPLRATPMAYGGESGQGYIEPGSATEQAFGLNPAFSLAPGSNEAKYLGYLFNNQFEMLWSNVAGRLNFGAIALLHDDPRTFTGALPYSGLPRQYAFLKSSNATCTATGGSYCEGGLKGFSMISRTSWSDPKTKVGRTGTLTYFGMRAFAGDHDTPQCGATWIYKVGQLIGMDGTGTIQYGNEDGTTHQDLLRFGNTSLNRRFGYAFPSLNGQVPYGYCSTTQWASSNHGSWDAQYGDQDSKYAYACADISGTYYPGTMNWGRKCVADLKDSSLNGGTGEQVVVQGTFVDTSTTPIAVEGHIHFSQNGQSNDPSESVGMTYHEGNTVCPGSEGCRTLDTTRVIQSMQNGAGPVTSSIASITPGSPTVVRTSSPHGAVLLQAGQVSGVSGTGVCNGTGPVTAIADSTHFTIAIDTSSCVGPSGGTFLSDFNPQRNFGVITKVLSPGKIMVKDDSFSVNITAVSPGNPTVFTAPANGIKNVFPIASIEASPSGFGPAFTRITTTGPNTFAAENTDNAHVTFRGVTTSGCSLNGTTTNVISRPSNTVFVVVFDSTKCVNPTGGFAFTYPEANVKILGATGQWAALNSDINHNGTPNCPACMGGVQNGTSVLAMTYIDQDHFSVPVNSTGFDPATWNGTVYAAFPNSYGDSHRISLCGGTMCGELVSSYETVVVHKIAQNLSDTDLTTTELNPDANWTGVQTKDKVVLLARGKNPPTAITGFTTTHTGTAQYLFGGLAAGVWDFKINGAPVQGSPFQVQNGDNSVHFESTAGALMASAVVQPCQVTDISPLPGGTVGSAYSQTLHATGCTAPLTWSLWYGSQPLCSGLSLNPSTGVLSGTLQNAEICTPTFQVTDSSSPATTATESLQITVTNTPVLTVNPLAVGFACVSGGANPVGQNVSIGAGGVTLNNWTASKNRAWLSVSPSTGTAASIMTLSVSCAGLAPGSYTDTINVTSTTSGITNIPQAISVSLVVSPAGTKAVEVKGNPAIKGNPSFPK